MNSFAKVNGACDALGSPANYFGAAKRAATCAGIRSICDAIEDENATVNAPALGRQYNAMCRVVGGDVEKISPSKRSGMIEAGTRVGPRPAAASSGAVAV